MFNEHRAGTMQGRRKSIFTGISAILFGMLACRPVIAIGWVEFLFIFVLLAVLLGPPLFRLFRSLSDFRDFKQNKKK
jgi:hypothetical protein